MTPAPLEPLRRAIGFLTVLPVGAGGGGPDRATTWFPVAGVLVGLPAFGLLHLPLPPPARAALALAAWTAVTGALHEDGWADVLDAALAPGARADRVRILSDPRVGAHGATGLVLLLLLRFAALLTVIPAAALVAPVVGRWSMVLSLSRAPALRGRGLGATFSAGPRPVAATTWALGLLAGLTILAGPAATGAACAAGGLAAAGTGGFLVARLGGLNGDGHGAAGLVAETVALWSFVPWAA